MKNMERDVNWFVCVMFMNILKMDLGAPDSKTDTEEIHQAFGFHFGENYVDS